MENTSNMHETLGPGVGEVGNWNAFFLSAKRDHLLSASPLILIKEFIELRCFSKRIEGHALISLLRESWNDDFCLCVFSASSELGKKAGTKQKKIHPVCSLFPGPVTECFINSACTSVPSSQATWNSARGCHSSRCANRGGQACSAPLVAVTEPGTQKPRKEEPAAGDCAVSLGASDSSFFTTLPQLLLLVLFQPLVCQLLLCTMANFWGIYETQNKWHWIYYGEACS